MWFVVVVPGLSRKRVVSAACVLDVGRVSAIVVVVVVRIDDVVDERPKVCLFCDGPSK